MFDFLKKKITSFVDGITGRETQGKKSEEKQVTQTGEKTPAPTEIEPEIPKIKEPVIKEKMEAGKKTAAIPETTKTEEPAREIVQPKKETLKPIAETVPPKKAEIRKEITVPKISEREKPEPVKEEKPEPAKDEKQRIKLSPFTAIKSFITSEVEIKESDLKGLLDNLELELLEADVEMTVSQEIVARIREKLIGRKIEKKSLHPFIGSAIKETLIGILENEKSFDILDVVRKSEKPAKIMFIGINGSGKTTSIAKIAKLLMDNNYKVVFAAADTFRAAAIEQMEVHATRLGIKMIKRDYGSDPTSVAYDAANYAKAHNVDVVLIDTAGRQDTNASLINEIKKMNRVILPTLKIYVGESIAGNAIIEQVSTFNREIGVDGVILTKLDCDAKGGTVLSINKVTGIPIVYIGTGQKYGDLELFDAHKIVDRILE